MVRRHHPALPPSSSTAPIASHRTASADIIYFAQAPWDTAKSRGHRIVEAIAQQRRIFYVEPPLHEPTGCVDVDITCRGGGLFIVTPHILAGVSPQNEVEALRFSVNQLVQRFHIEQPMVWYETATALPFTRHLTPLVRVYDYPRQSTVSIKGDTEPGEGELLRLADVIFTSTQSVYETVRRLRPGVVFLFPDCPSGAFKKVLAAEQARPSKATPKGAVIGSIVPAETPIDLPLLEAIATARPDLTFEVLGAVEPEHRPPNITYRPLPPAAELAHTVRGWDAAVAPIASHRGRPPFPIATIGELLHAGIPVVATPTTDIVGPLGRRGIINLAQTAREFETAIEFAFEQRSSERWRAACSDFLQSWTWERTAEAMLGAVASIAEPYSSERLFPAQRAVGAE